MLELEREGFVRCGSDVYGDLRNHKCRSYTKTQHARVPAWQHGKLGRSWSNVTRSARLGGALLPVR